jgi:hypothetical protein
VATTKEAPLQNGELGGLKIVPVQARSPFINILIYGESGVGKTTLAGSADAVPDLRPVLVIDIEGGTESLVRSYPEVDTVRVTNWIEMQRVYDDLYEGNHPYKTVILDSLSEIQKFSMYFIMEELKKKYPDREVDVPSMREWGINLEQMRRYVRAFRDLPINTIMTALSKDEKNERTGAIMHKIKLTGQFADECPAFLDIVAYLYTKTITTDGEPEETRLLLTAKTEEVVAKDRTGSLPGPVMISPTMKEIFSAFKQGARELETK